MGDGFEGVLDFLEMHLVRSRRVVGVKRWIVISWEPRN